MIKFIGTLIFYLFISTSTKIMFMFHCCNNVVIQAFHGPIKVTFRLKKSSSLRGFFTCFQANVRVVKITVSLDNTL